MANIHWTNKSGGTWQTATNWSTGTVPASTDTAIIDAKGSYTVTSSAAVTVDSLQTISTVTVDIITSTFQMTNGTGAGVNAGTIIDDNSSVLFLGGTVNNTGTIRENSTGNSTDIRLTYPIVTLTGGGSLIMSNNANNRIYGLGSGYKLFNVDNKISGAGQLGSGQMTLINEKKGVINANQTTQLILNTPNTVTNTGLIEATGSGGLLIQNTNIGNAGGTVAANGKASHVDLSGCTIQGGTLSDSNGGVIQTIGGNGGIDGQTFGALTLKGTLLVTNSTVLYVAGTIINSGLISEMAGVNSTDIRITTQTATLQGGGAITMSNSDNNRIYGVAASNQLINVDNTISGSGQIGAAQLTFTNEAKGVIDATNKAITGVSSGVLTINCNDGMVNAGLIEGTNTAGLAIVNTTVQNAGGTIQAAGTGSHVDLNGATIEGGKLTTSRGGLIENVSSSTLDGFETGTGAITNAGTFEILNSTAVTLLGVINNTGTLLESSAGNSTDIRIGSTVVTLQGGGSLLMSDNANNRIYGNTPTLQLNNLDNTISGAGQIGVAQMQLSNGGTIDATGTNAMVVNTGSYDLTNTAGGLLEAAGVGGMVVQSGILSNSGTLLAANGSSLVLQSGVFNLNSNNATLAGGTWEATGGGTLAITGGPVAVDAANIVVSGAGALFETGNGSTFADLGTSLTTIAGGAQLSVLSGAVLTVAAGTISNAGTVKLNSGGTLAVGNLLLGSTGLLTGNGVEKGSVTDNSTVVATGGTLDVTRNLSGTGALQIASHATAQIDGALTVKSVVFETGTTETLALSTPGNTLSTISGFANTDVIDLIKTAATSLSYSGSSSNGVLTVKNGSQTVAAFNFSGNYKTANFSLSPDGSSGTKITGAGLPGIAFIGGASPGGATLADEVGHGSLTNAAMMWGDFVAHGINGFGHAVSNSFASASAPDDRGLAILHQNVTSIHNAMLDTLTSHLHVSAA